MKMCIRDRVNEVNKIAALKNDSSFVSNMNSITASLESMGKVIGEGTGAVSYTHLDAYKRQVRSRAICSCVSCICKRRAVASRVSSQSLPRL